MPDLGLLIGFSAAALLVLLMPGPGVLYVVARSLAQGRRAGLVSVLGLSAGVLVHVVAAAAGISALLVASSTAFEIVKFIGAGYLIYLGIRTLLARSSGSDVEIEALLPDRRLFWDGVLVSVLNPKIAVFFLAFLPQFIEPSAHSAAGQVFVLGLFYVGLALMTDGGYAVLASALRSRLRTGILHGPVPRYVSGFVYIGLGLHTAFSGRRP